MSPRLSPLSLLVALALVVTGCPADEPPPPLKTPRPRRPDPVASERPVETPVTEQPSSSDRARLLAMTPADVFAGGLRGRLPGELAPLLAGEGALAMSEQLGAAKVPLEALDLCLVVFDRARESARAELVEDAVRAQLMRSLEVQAGDQPALKAWVVALAERVFVRADLTAAVAFLTKVRTIYALSAALTRPR